MGNIFSLKFSWWANILVAQFQDTPWSISPATVQFMSFVHCMVAQLLSFVRVLFEFSFVFKQLAIMEEANKLRESATDVAEAMSEIEGYMQRLKDMAVEVC